MTTQKNSSHLPASPTVQINETASEYKEHFLKAWAGWLLIGVAVVAAIVLISAYGRFVPPINDFLHDKLKFRDAAAWGQLGDFMGGILNPLISACTLAVAVMVWDLQKKELSETQKALKEQAKTSEQQRQEQRFFDLLGLYQRTVDSISYVDRVSTNVDAPVVQSTGKQVLSNWLANSLPTELQSFRQHGISEKLYWRGDATSYQITEESLATAWGNSSAGNQFDHYFRVVFRLLAESEALLCEQHYRYVKLLRAQFSRSELTLIGFNLWLDEEGKNIVPLAKKYGLLKHLPNGHLRTQLENVVAPHIFGQKFSALQTNINALDALPC